MMLTEQENEAIKDAWMNGITVMSDSTLEALTMDIWESILKLPYPMDAKFNLLGNISTLDVLDENKQGILRLLIDTSEVKFELKKSRMTRDDSVISTFATMATLGVLNKMCN